MKLEFNITKFFILVSLLVSLGLPEVVNYLQGNLVYCPKTIEFDKPLGLILPYLNNPTFVNFVFAMYIFNYNSSNLENHYGSKKYLIVLLLSFLLTSLMGLIVGLTFKNLFEFDNFYNSLWIGITPITMCLRSLYYNKIDKDVMLFGHLVHSRNVIWIELLLLNIFGDPYYKFGIQLAGVLAGHILYNIFNF